MRSAELSALVNVVKGVPKILASEQFRAPKDYADSFKVIEEEEIVNNDLGQRLRQMAKFRNRLVHLYSEIDDSYVHQFMNENLNDIEEFKSIIIKRYKT